MAIAAQHTQFVTNDYISPIPAEDLIKVALKKQEMYDEGRKQIKQVYDNYGKLRGTIINENAKNYFDQEFNKLVKNVQGNAGLDFANIGNVEAVINLGKPFENDQYIKTALENGQEYQRRVTEMNGMAKDKRSSDNDLVYMYDVNSYIESGGLDTKLAKNKSYQQYVDISAKMKAAEKEIEAETFTTFEQGPAGYIQQVEHKRKTREDVYNRLMSSLTPEEQAQLQIHSQANMYRLGSDVLYQSWVGSNKEEKLLADETRKKAMQELGRLTSVKKPTAEQISQMNSLQQVISYNEQVITAANENIKMNPDDFDMGEYVPFFTKRFVDGISKQLSFNNTKTELKENKVYMANLENQFKLSQIAAQGAESRKTKEFEQQLDYTTQSGASANRLSGITKVLKTVPTTKGSAAISDMITQITNNPDLKQSVKDGYLEQLNTLLNTYKYAEANKDKGNLIVSINRSMGKGYNTSLSDFLEANPLTLMSSGQIAQIEVRSKTSGSGKESKTPDQIREEERAKTQGDLDAKAQLFKDNSDLAKLLYGKSSSGGAGADAGATPEQIKAMQDMLNKGPK
jgi:hypothetical protein